jgi:hypothetical protein
LDYEAELAFIVGKRARNLTRENALECVAGYSVFNDGSIRDYQRKTTQDLSSWFIFLRIIGNSIWIGYAIEIDSMMMLINTIVTVGSSVFIAYYKILELHKERLDKKMQSNYNNYTYDVLINNEYYNKN